MASEGYLPCGVKTSPSNVMTVTAYAACAWPTNLAWLILGHWGPQRGPWRPALSLRWWLVRGCVILAQVEKSETTGEVDYFTRQQVEQAG